MGITVSAENNYAYYNNYDFCTKEAQHLHCPHCDADEIAILEESKFYNEDMLGDVAQCWMCKKEFIITGNCWKMVARK